MNRKEEEQIKSHHMVLQGLPNLTPDAGAAGGSPGGTIKRSAVLLLVLHLSGCTSFTILPTASERKAVAGGNKAIVLLRVECTIESQKPYEPFRFSLADDNITFGLGSFKTGGEPERLVTLRFLSQASRRAGWTYFVLPHGLYYLAVYPPRRADVATYGQSLKGRPLWTMDVPEKTRVVYAGTLRLSGESDWLILNGRIMRSIDSDKISLVNDQELACKLVAEHFPAMGEPHIALIQRHEGPIILRAPLPAPNSSRR